jgi:hypothetical protein
MIKDIHNPKVEDVVVAISPPPGEPDAELWEVFLINLKEVPLENVLVSSHGFGELDGREVKTSRLLHLFPEMQPHSVEPLEQIQPEVFRLTNEFWVSFKYAGTLYDKKYTFVRGSIDTSYFVSLPLLDREGVMIGGE